MLRLVDFSALGRALRQDDPGTLGQSTPHLIEQAVDSGRPEEAKRLARYVIQEGKGLHDLMCDRVWDLLTRVARRHGETEMLEILRGSQSTWMLRRTWKAFLAMAALLTRFEPSQSA